MKLISAEPQLYSVDSSGTPVLTAVRDSTGHVSYPAQPYGSERTGEHGAALQTIALSGLGTVQATAVVHMHHGADITAPFTVASIALDEGPLVRGVLTSPNGVGVGSRVRAVTVARFQNPENDNTTVELRFAPVNEQEQS